MKSLFIIILSLFAITASAQNCSEASLFQTPGRWKPGMKGSEGGSPADLVKEKKLVDAIHSMIKAKYAPMSVESIFHGTYMPPEPAMPGNGYTYSIIPLNFYCDGDHIKTESETSSYFSISANMFEVEIYDTAYGDEILLLGFNYMPDMPVEKDGCWCFKEKDAPLGFGMTGKSNMWLITYDGKLPYAYVTKKEFLEKRKQSLYIIMAMDVANVKNVLRNNEIEKTYKETEYKNDPAKLARWMKMDYLSIKGRYEQQLSEIEKNYEPAFAKIETQLRLPASELSQAAIVKEDSHDYLSYLFTDDNDASGKVLIKPNPSYFNRKLPKSTPQFFAVYVRADPKEPIASRFMTDVIKAVDFSRLKTMLGKRSQ